LLQNTSSKEPVNLASWSRSKNLIDTPRSSRSIVAFLARYELAVEESANRRLAVAFDELALAI
jgi:hypothetical protein